MGITQSVEVTNLKSDSSGQIRVLDETTSSTAEAIRMLIYALGPYADEIITQLQIMNTHLSVLTNEHITEQDIGE